VLPHFCTKVTGRYISILFFKVTPIQSPLLMANSSMCLRGEYFSYTHIESFLQNLFSFILLLSISLHEFASEWLKKQSHDPLTVTSDKEMDFSRHYSSPSFVVNSGATLQTAELRVTVTIVYWFERGLSQTNFRSVILTNLYIIYIHTYIHT
jgi:hypothetical protein